MNEQIPLSNAAIAPGSGAYEHSVEVAPDLACRRLMLVNVAYVGLPAQPGWVLIDTGLAGSATAIRRAAAERFGHDIPPAAIILTHGHFDHVGALEALAKEWDVPIYAHRLEHPFLDGTQSYPPPDTHAGGGIMPKLAPLFSRGPVDVSPRLRPLPESGEAPHLPGWRWLHTPGHTPGHVSLWRDSDHTIVAGDAFITTRQESAYAVAIQKPELHGPPRYFTPDWDSARASVERLAALEPELAVTGHGRPMRGPEMRHALQSLARDFDRIARPAR